MIVSPSCKYVIVGTDNGSIIAYNNDLHQISCRFDDPDAGTFFLESLSLICIGYINCLSFGGKKNCYLISSCDEGYLRIFGWKAKLNKDHLVKTEEPFEFHFSTDLYLAAINEENEICLYSLSENEMKPKPLHIFKDQYEGIFSSF